MSVACRLHFFEETCVQNDTELWDNKEKKNDKVNFTMYKVNTS